MARKFAALRVIGTIFKVLAWIALLFGLFGAVVILIAALTLDQSETAILNLGGPLTGVAAFIVILVIAIVQFLFLYAVGESIYLFLALEENTRRTAYFTQQLFSASQSNYPVPPSPPDYED